MSILKTILSLSTFKVTLYISILFAIYTIALITYRIFLSTLAKFPGPTFAAATGWYEFYYDCILCGRMPNRIDRLHDIYGPIVRISPWEVHIADPAFIKQLLSPYAKLDKDTWYYRFVGFPQAGVPTGPADLHRIRRRPLAKLFSKASVHRSMSIIEDGVSALLEKLDSHKGTKREVEISNALRCLAFDVACAFTLPRFKSKLQEESFAPEFNKMFIVGRYVSIWQRHVRFLFPAILRLPRRFMRFLAQDKYLAIMNVHDDIKTQAGEVISSNGTSWAPQCHLSLLHSLVRSDLPENEISAGRMTEEALVVIGAGVEALANPMAITIFELLKDPEKMCKLKRELVEIEEDTQAFLSHDRLRKLPYLNAVILEGLRLGKENGRFPRINPGEPTHYGEYVVPAGTVISISLKDLHLNDSVFEDALTFKPERWLDPEKAVEMHRNFLPFSRGDRVCLGRHLATAEAFLCVGNLVHRFNMQLWRTSQRDVDTCFDYFAPETLTDTTGFRVLLD